VTQSLIGSDKFELDTPILCIDREVMEANRLVHRESGIDATDQGETKSPSCPEKLNSFPGTPSNHRFLGSRPTIGTPVLRRRAASHVGWDK